MDKTEHQLKLENNMLRAKLSLATHMLGNAKRLLKARQIESTKLKAELAQKNTLLHEEMLASEATNQRLAKALNKLADRFSQTIITTEEQVVAQSSDAEQHNS